MTEENLRNEIRNSLCNVAFKPRHYRIISEGVAYALGKIEYPAGAGAIVHEEAEAELKRMAETRTIRDDLIEVLPKDRDTRADLLAVAQQIGRAVYPFCYEVGEGKAVVDAMAHYQEADMYEHRLKMAEAPSVVLNSDVLLASNRAQSALRHLLRYLEGGEVWHLPKAWHSARETLEAAHDGEALRARMRALDLAVIGALPEWLRHDMGMDTPPVVNVVQADAKQTDDPARPQQDDPAQPQQDDPAQPQQAADSTNVVSLADAIALYNEMWTPWLAARRKVEQIQAELTALRSHYDEARDELARLRPLLARLTPRTYREGDPSPNGRVLWWRGAKHGWVWVWLPPGHYLAHGDIYLDLPPPSEWPQPWTGSSGPLDPAQHHDALEKVTQERDEALRKLAVAEEAIEAKDYMERLAILRRALATGDGTDVALPDRESDEAYRTRLLDACPDGAAYTAEDIGNLSGDALDGIGARLGVTRA